MNIQLPKKYLPLIISAVSGLLAVFLINLYITQQAEQAKKRAVPTKQERQLARVVIAAEDIPAGKTIKENMLQEKTVPISMLQPRIANSIDRVVDKIALVPIAKDEQVLLNKITLPARETSLSTKIPKGKRAITIPVDNITSVAGMIAPGDHVDLVAMVPFPVTTAEGKQATQMTFLPLFQNVLVLAMGQQFTSIPKLSEEKTFSPMITLALSPQEANLVAFVQEQGKIRLILRSPGDTQLQSPVPANWDTLFRMLMPQASGESVKEPRRKVEIYRGLKKEIRVLE